MVPAQGVGFHEDQREDGEHRERHDLLNDFQLPDRERAPEFGASDAVGRDLETVFEQRDAPAQQDDGEKPEAFESGFEGDMPVPRQRHESVGDDEQQNGGDSLEHDALSQQGAEVGQLGEIVDDHVGRGFAL